jgi:hypothetical protein
VRICAKQNTRGFIASGVLMFDLRKITKSFCRAAHPINNLREPSGYRASVYAQFTRRVHLRHFVQQAQLRDSGIFSR